MLKLWLSMLLCLSVAFAATVGDPKPVLIGQHVINYAEISTDQLLHAALSQRYPDLGNRYVQAVYSMEIPSYTLVDLRGVEFDFMVGRRITNTHTAYTFKWDALSVLESELQLTLQIFETSSLTTQPLTSPQPPLYELTLSALNNKSDVYLFLNHASANIYKASFILPMSTATGKALMLPGPSVKTTKTKFWLGIVGTLKSHDEASSYEYTFRLPVATANRGSMSIRDPDNIMGLNYTNWTSASSITAALYANIVNPVMAYRTAGYVTLPTSPVPTPTKAPSNILNSTPVVLSSVISPAPHAQEPAPVLPPSAVPPNNTVAHESDYFLKNAFNFWIGIMVIILLVVCVMIVVIVVWRRSKGTKRHAYANVEDDQAQRDAVNVKLDLSNSDEEGGLTLPRKQGTSDSQPMQLLGSRLTSNSEGSDLSSHPDVGGASNNNSPWLDGYSKNGDVALDDSS